MADTDAFKNQLEFEKHLKPGDLVRARFTNSYRQLEFLAMVVRKNRASVRVKIIEGRQGYPIGHEIGGIPLWGPTTYKLWSWNNCVLPAPDLPPFAGSRR